MPEWMSGAAGFMLLSGAGLISALFYRALAAASPARLEELNAQLGLYESLPDIPQAMPVAGGVKLVSYITLIAAIGHHFFSGGDVMLASYFRTVAASVGALLAIETVALVAAGYHSGHLLYRLVPFIAAFSRAGGVFLSSGKVVAEIVARLTGREGPPDPEEEAEEEMLDAVSEGEREGVIEDQEREMIESIIELKDAEVSEIMTPRTEVIMMTEEMTLDDAMEQAVESGHSRLPVAAANADNMVGVLHVKDILSHVRHGGDTTVSVKELMRAPYFIPETKRIRELLQEFRATNVHMAIVLDEYGGTSGVATIEDILEEIVGEIEDEYDTRQPPGIAVLGPRKAIVSGQTAVSEINDTLGIEISEEEEYETIAGFVLFRIGRIPAKGETIEIDGIHLRIIDADERRIHRMAMEIPGRGAAAQPGTRP